MRLHSETWKDLFELALRTTSFRTFRWLAPTSPYRSPPYWQPRRRRQPDRSREPSRRSAHNEPSRFSGPCTLNIATCDGSQEKSSSPAPLRARALSTVRGYDLRLSAQSRERNGIPCSGPTGGGLPGGYGAAASSAASSLMKTPPTTERAWKPRCLPSTVQYQSVIGTREGDSLRKRHTGVPPG